jgi:AmmeMemoRadiSam system protein A
MITEPLNQEERRLLLHLAREAIEKAVRGEDYSLPDLEIFPMLLRENGVCFVTLTMPNGELRGCIGGLEATRPLVVDICDHAAAAALEDYRFLPVRPEEVPFLHIEISRLTRPEILEYSRPEELPHLLNPYQDGVALRDGFRRATFLPQVWEKLPDPCAFLSHLCQKMGASPDLWRKRKLQVEIYHVEEFEEEVSS